MDETDNLFMELEETNNKTFLYDYWTIYKYMNGFLCDDTDVRDFECIKNKYSSDIVDKLRKYSKIFLDMDYFGTNFPEIAINLGIVSSSYAMHNLLNWMEQAIYNFEKDNNQYLKFVIFSAHDSTIGAMESFLRYVLNTKVESCGFDDSRFFELYVDDNGKYKVRYLKGDNAIKFNIDYNYFKDKINEKIWSDEKVEEYCQTKKNDNKKEKDIMGFSIMIILLIFNAILIIYLVAFYFNKKSNI